MHFGRTDLSQASTDFALPPNAPRTSAFLKLNWQGQGLIHAGAPVWVCKDWLGSLYPEQTKAQDYLTAYSLQFKCCEVNSTFYQLLSAERISKWRQAVSPEFKFCPKLYRGITEQMSGPGLPTLVKQCATSFEAFGGTYGIAIAQFSEVFGPKDINLLKRLLSHWPESLPLAVELRHPGWFHQHVLSDEVVDLLYRFHAATVITDTPGRRDALHMSLSRPRVIIRFNGVDHGPVDEQRLQAWSARLLEWANHRLEDLYFFCHQAGDALIPETVNKFILALHMRGYIDLPLATMQPQRLAPLERILRFTQDDESVTQNDESVTQDDKSVACREGSDTQDKTGPFALSLT